MHSLGNSSITLPISLLAQTANQGFPASLGLGSDVFNLVVNLIGAIAILLLGWIVAAILASVVRGLLKRTKIDNQLSNLTAGQAAGAASVENIAATIVFWVVMILAIVAALNVLNLTTVSQPLNNFLNQIFAYLPRLGSAAILIAVAWVVATLAKLLVTRIARSFGLDERLSPTIEDDLAPQQGQFLLSETLGNALYWFVFLFFLPLILGVLGLEGPLQPVQNLLNDFLTALPNIVKAVVIGAIGWLVARVVRGIVTNLLTAIGADRIGNRVGLAQTTNRQSLSWIIGTIVYVLILIPTAVAALEALQIQSISAPASAMLNQILSAIPQIFTAVLILAIGYVIGQFVKDLVTNLLTGIGFNNVLYWLGLRSDLPMQLPPPPTEESVSGEPLLIEPDARGFYTRTPSEIVGIVVLVGILLFSAVAATNVLGIPALTTIVSGLLVILGQILVGLVIFAIGLYLANLAYNLIASSGTSQSKILGQTAKISILVLVAAMALQQIGIAPNIINLAFGLLLGAIAVAIALAFGLGGRDVAAEQLRDWLATFKRDRSRDRSNY
ncbi:MAG: mechanosensitive ion channel [Leptolyngbyaceae cyanobacterium RU_5_1]|nr:mechanosensitive ion channel [Leptolyngbyaceae cyanobacterium RU_5_1]